MKTKIAIDLPSRAKFIAGLAPREVHPALVRAEEAAAKAEQHLERARAVLADRERTVETLPARIQRGEERGSTLVDAMRERDAAAMLVKPAAEALEKAREVVAAEEAKARLAVEREVDRRHQQLADTAAEINPLLRELVELATALVASQSPGACPAAPDWQCSPSCSSADRIRNMMARGAG